MNTVIFPEDVANAVQSAYLQTEDEDARNLLLSVGAEFLKLHNEEVKRIEATIGVTPSSMGIKHTA